MRSKHNAPELIPRDPPLKVTDLRQEANLALLWLRRLGEPPYRPPSEACHPIMTLVGNPTNDERGVWAAGFATLYALRCLDSAAVVYEPMSLPPHLITTCVVNRCCGRRSYASPESARRLHGWVM